MGGLLAKPVVEVESEAGGFEGLKFGAASMQGWRPSQEDAHAAELQLTKNVAFFDVYDGHGGGEVAKYASKYLHARLVASAEYKKADYANALRKTFLSIDREILLDTKAQEELVAFCEEANEGESGDEGNGETIDLSTVTPEQLFHFCQAQGLPPQEAANT